MKGEALALRAAAAATERLAEDVLVLDLRRLSPLADWFVIASVNSTVHAQSLADELVRELKSEGQRPHHVEGTEHGQWILLDYFDVVVHIMLSDVRQYYGLERLWGDAPRQTLDSASAS
jgi:ribosome-associated protein